MSQQEIRAHSRPRRNVSLSIRVSLLLMIAAIVPLMIVVASSELLSSPTLISQANVAMQSDLKTRTQLIDAYLGERLLDAETLTQVPSVQQYLAASVVTPDLTLHAMYSLEAGIYRDKHYTNWSLFDPHGTLRLAYPTAPKPHGKYMVPPDNLQAVTAGKSFISDVYFDPATNKASVDIYAPVVSSSPKMLLGFMRAMLNIDYVWDVVNSDRGIGNGYAFILDENGVRVADTNPAERFTAIAALPSLTQTRISSEARYGAAKAVSVLTDQSLVAMQRHPPSSPTVQMTPAGQHEPYQVARQPLAALPWTYFVLSPVSTVTAVANQQLDTTLIIALIVLLLAALVGWIIGQRLTRPVLRSVDQLRKNSELLSALATRQQGAASEQTWVVDSSQVGLQSVQYYTDAMRVAANRLSGIGAELNGRWRHLDAATASDALDHVVKTAQYIENAAQFQESSNQKLATAIKVTTQVTEQLASGATSAASAAAQLEQVVNRLRSVVGE